MPVSKIALGFCILLIVTACQKSEIQSTSASTRVGQSVDSEINPHVRLRKLSFHLTGQTPQLADYKALDLALANQSQTDFFTSITKRYLATPQHIGKMVNRLDELFRVKSAEVLPESLFLNLAQPLSAVSPVHGDSVNAMDFIFEKIARENLNWDTLLSGKEYSVISPPLPINSVTFSDLSFFAEVAPTLPDVPSLFFPSTQPLKANLIQFSPEDPRIAGAVTTARFFSRYNTTSTNKNRGRAAALFRIFLCDEMHQVVQTNSDNLNDLLNQAFPNPKVHAQLPLKVDPHGTQPDCMACHYKLDPLGRTFLTSSNILSDEPSPGSLTYKTYDGNLVSLPARGLGEAARNILSQTDYKRCQVKHFWRWFIDGSAPPTENRLTELTKAFDDVNHRTNDFVAYLVNQPEFFHYPANQKTTLTQVKENLQRCDECHSGSARRVPSFTHFPIGGSEQSHLLWASNITDALDLANDGDHRNMPPKTSQWQPSQPELETLKDWVRDGFSDESGNSTVDTRVTQGWLK